jgi:uncharacterized damage-inducible protein DinB
MITEHFRRLILRDVDGLIRQIEAYEDESDLWVVPGGTGNSPGNLALHISGNLRLFIGHVLGGIEYTRDRDAEFSRKEVPRVEVVAGLRTAAEAVDRTLASLPDDRLNEPYSIKFGEDRLITGRFLAHLCTHLAYHLGQVDYHRRIITGQGAVKEIQGIRWLID